MNAIEPDWEAIKREFIAACSQSAQAARSEIVQDLSRFLRRLRQYQTESEWYAAVLDGASELVREAAIFAIRDDALCLRGQCNLSLPVDLTFPVRSAGAFATAVDSKDPVIALRTPAEVTGPLSTPESGARAHIVPILNGSRVVAILFAGEGDRVDLNALELLAGMASLVLERQSNRSLHAQIAVATKPASQNNGPVLPGWAQLSGQQRELHIRAQRFSRVAVAEMQLSRPEACRAGREQANLYVFLNKEIDKAREAYRKQFMTTPSMVDYLHLELVRTAAEGDERKLGADYPGRLL